MSAKQALLRAVERLPDQQKEVLILKIWGELTFDEIARTLDESLNTVASRYRYGLQKLRDWVPKRWKGKKESLPTPHERVRKIGSGIKRASSSPHQ